MFPAVNSSTGFAISHNQDEGEVFFVYGTLKKGEHNHRMMTGSEFLGQASAPGKLYVSYWGLPGYVMDEEGTVHGELYRGTKGMLAILDHFEGYNEADPKKSFYIRSRVTCTTVNGQSIDAWVYEFNGDVEEDRRLKLGKF